MEIEKNKQISRTVSRFHNRDLPDFGGRLAGYGALIDAFRLAVPIPVRLAVISQKHRKYETPEWLVLTPRHAPDDTVAGHLAFALRYEGVELAVLNGLFAKTGGKVVESWVREEPVGRYARRIWFFYEWLTGKKLRLPDAATGNFVDALDRRQYFAGRGESSKRHRVRNNMTGVPDFCPLVRRTAKLEAFTSKDWRFLAAKSAQQVSTEMLTRAASYLVLEDSRASFAIEGETPGPQRAERWGAAISQAGRRQLTIEELLRLQAIIFGDLRFVKLGLRKEGGFIGTHDRRTGHPRPSHISARWQDLDRLLTGLIAANHRLLSDRLDPIVAAAMVAFGFVFIHPFVDGNGRVHRYLIHHVLAEHQFNPHGIVFPISAAILENLDLYRRVLESYSNPRLSQIKWDATVNGNVDVMNETIDLYRYFDATPAAEFLYDCVAHTIDVSLPSEIRYLERYDRMRYAIANRMQLPARKADLLIRFLAQNDGKLSKRAIEKEFALLSTSERRYLEKKFAEIFSKD